MVHERRLTLRRIIGTVAHTATRDLVDAIYQSDVTRMYMLLEIVLVFRVCLCNCVITYLVSFKAHGLLCCLRALCGGIPEDGPAPLSPSSPSSPSLSSLPSSSPASALTGLRRASSCRGEQ